MVARLPRALSGLAMLALMYACVVDIPAPPAASGTGGGSSANSASGGAVGVGGGTSAQGGQGVGGSGGTSGGTYVSEVMADAPLGYWRLDEDNYPVAHDSSGHGLDGTFKNAVDLQAAGALVGDPDMAIHLSGNGWVDLGDVLDFPGSAPFTLEAWIRPESDGGIAGKAVYTPGYDGYIWALMDGGMLRLHRASTLPMSSSDTAQTNDVVADYANPTYVHIVTVFDGINVRHYVNGQNVDPTSASPAVMQDIPDAFLIGRVQDWGNFTGDIDEVAVYDHPLAPARILAHYTVGAGTGRPYLSFAGGAGKARPPFKPYVRFSRIRLTDGFSNRCITQSPRRRAPDSEACLASGTARGPRSTPASTEPTAPPSGCGLCASVRSASAAIRRGRRSR
jgi:Concanavalin A-like lectin/glucanases superfamily